MLVRFEQIMEALQQHLLVFNQAHQIHLLVILVAVEANIAQIYLLLKWLDFVFFESPVDELRLPIIVDGLYFQLFEGEAHGKQPAGLAIFVANVNVFHADLDVVDDLAGQLHEEALLLLSFFQQILFTLIQCLLHHLLKSLQALFHNLLLDQFELVELRAIFLPLILMKWIDQKIYSIYFKLHRLGGESIPRHTHI